MTQPTDDHELISLGRPAPFITFYSFKGGVGRSMALINVASIVAARGFRVLVIDMDLEAPGISFLARRHGGSPEVEVAQPGFVDGLLDARQRGAESDLFALSAAEFVERYSTRFDLPEGFDQHPRSELHIMPAGRLDPGYAERFEQLDLAGLYREGLGLGLVAEFKAAVQGSERFDYVFVDSRTGFSEESGVCTRDLADHLIVLSGLNRQNVQGTARFLAALRAAGSELSGLEVVLSPIPNSEDALVDARVEKATAIFEEAWGATVPTDLQIPYHPQLALTEEPHVFRRQRGYLYDAYRRLEKRVLALIGDTVDGWRERSSRALQANRLADAEAALRMAGMLADEPGWSDPLVMWLPGHLEDLVTEPMGERFLEHMHRGASQHIRTLLDDWLFIPGQKPDVQQAAAEAPPEPDTAPEPDPKT